MRFPFQGKHKRNASAEGYFSSPRFAEWQANNTSPASNDPQLGHPLHVHYTGPGPSNLGLQPRPTPTPMLQPLYPQPAHGHGPLWHQQYSTHANPTADPVALEAADIEAARRASLLTEEQRRKDAEWHRKCDNERRQAETKRKALQEAKEAAYRLSLKYGVSGSLEYSEPLVDGFYMLLGDYPELEDILQARPARFPTLDELRLVHLMEGDVREVVYVDADQDNGLVAIQEKAASATADAVARSGEDGHVRATERIRALAEVVVGVLGGAFDSEETLQQIWQAESAKQKEKNRSIVIHLAQLPAGTCRHRALLFKVLADSLNLMCQLQRSRHSEREPERVVNVVQIDKKDFVVDLVYEPGKLELLQHFAARNPAFAHLRSGTQPSTRYPNPVPPLPQPHPPQSMHRPSATNPHAPSHAPTAPPASPAPPTAPPDMSTLALGPGSTERSRSVLNDPTPNAATANTNGPVPTSSGPTRPTSGTNVNLGVPSTVPPNPVVTPLSGTPPAGVPHAGVYQQNDPGGRHARAPSWGELACRPTVSNLLDISDEPGNGFNNPNWVTFSTSFKLGDRLNAANQAQHRANPPATQGGSPPPGGTGSPFANPYHSAMMYSGAQAGFHDPSSHIGHLRGHNSDGVPTTHYIPSSLPMQAPLPLNFPLQNGPTTPNHAATTSGVPPPVPLQPGPRPLLSNAYHPHGSSSMHSERSSSGSSQHPPTLQSPTPVSAAAAAAAAYPFPPPNMNPAGLVHAHTVQQPSPPQQPHSPHAPPHHSQSTPTLIGGQLNTSLPPPAGDAQQQLQQALIQQQKHQLRMQHGFVPNGIVPPAVGSAPAGGFMPNPKAGVPQPRPGQLPPVTPPHPLHAAPPLMNGFTSMGNTAPPRPPGMYTSPPQPPKPPSQPSLHNPSPPHTSPMNAGGARLGPLGLTPAIPPGTTHTAAMAKQQQRSSDPLFSELSPFEPRQAPPPAPRLGSSASYERLVRAQGATSPGASSQNSQQQLSATPFSPFNNPQAAAAAAAAAAGLSPGSAMGPPTHSPSQPSLSGHNSNNSSSSNLQGPPYDQAQEIESQPTASHIPNRLSPHSATPASPLKAEDSEAAAAQPATACLSDIEKSLMAASAVGGAGVGAAPAGPSQRQMPPPNGLSQLTPMPLHVIRYPHIGPEMSNGLQPLPTSQPLQGLPAQPLPPPTNGPPPRMLMTGQPPIFLPTNPVAPQPTLRPHYPPSHMLPPYMPQPPLLRAPAPQPPPPAPDPTGGTGVEGAPDPESTKTGTKEDISLKTAFGMWEIHPADLDYNGQRLGVGSYGEVYKGTWQGTDVAIKRFLDQHISEKIRHEFKHEVQLMSKLRHPNIVLFMGAVIQPTELAIVSEFVPRGSLFRLLHRTPARIEPRRLLVMAKDIAKGMQYLHSRQPSVVHRDLKSPNLLVDMDFTIKIADFGLSRVANATANATPRSSCAGTPGWMAPEILRNDKADEKSDVFSFGVILWELVTRKEPWGGLNPMQVVGAVGFRQQRLQVPSDLDPELAQIIHACFQEQPHLRPSFKDILEKLAGMQALLPSPSCMAVHEAEVQREVELRRQAEKHHPQQ